MTAEPASMNWAAFNHEWTESHEAYTRRAERQNDYYLNEQYTDELRAKLGDRPALTLNLSQRVINTLLGHYSRGRADIRFKPRRGGATAETAHALNRLVDAIYDMNHYTDYLEPQMFADGMIEDRGYMDVRMDFSENPLGEVKIRHLNPREVIPDSSATGYDPREWRRVIYTPWLTLDEIEAQYGEDKRRKVEALATIPNASFGHSSMRFQSFGGDEHGEAPPKEMVRSVRVIDHQYRRMHRCREFMDPTTGRTRLIPDNWSNDRVNMVAQQHGLVAQIRVRARVRWTVTADHVVLHDAWSPYEDFTIVPYFPIFRRGRTTSPMAILMDPQDQLNKTESQILHVINSTANSGWIYEDGSLVNMTAEDLERDGAKSGLVLAYARNRQPPTKIQPNQVPTGLESHAAKAREYVAALPGAESLMGDRPQVNVSGVALEQAKHDALNGLHVYFDNLKLTRKFIARRVLDCVQKFYTEERVFSVTDWRDPDAQEEQISINQMTADQIVNNVTIGTYDVEASEAPTKDTWEDMQFAYAIEMRSQGIQIPDYRVIRSSPLANREKIAEEVKQIQGFGEPDQIQQRLAEISVQMQEMKLAQLRAAALELEKRAGFHEARAMAELQGEERQLAEMMKKFELEIAEMEKEVGMMREEHRNKLEIAGVHANTKDGLTRFTKVLDSADRASDRESRERQEDTRARAGLMQALAGRSTGRDAA